MIHAQTKHLTIIQKILSEYPYTFYAFGSRVKGTHRPLSDLDLCYFDAIPTNVIEQLQEKFSESDLPFTVDLINWHTCKPHFQDLIKNDLVKMERATQ